MSERGRTSKGEGEGRAGTKGEEREGTKGTRGKRTAEREAEQQRQKELADQDAATDGNLVESPVTEPQDLGREEGEVMWRASKKQVNGANKSLKQKESLRIDTSESTRWRLYPLDINAAKKDSSSPLALCSDDGPQYR